MGPTTSVAELVAGVLRPLTTARWTDEEFFRRAQAAAAGAGRGPLVIIVDGVPSPLMGEQERLGRAIARLAADCRRADVKLVLTCHAHIWSLNRLAAYVAPNDLFLLAPLPASFGHGATGEDAARFDARASFVLGGLHPDKIVEIVGSRFGADIAARVAPHLSGRAATVASRPARRPSLHNVQARPARGRVTVAHARPSTPPASSTCISSSSVAIWRSLSSAEAMIFSGDNWVTSAGRLGFLAVMS